MDELHTQNSGCSNTSSELLSEQAIAKEGELCSADMKQFGFEETRADSVRTPDPTYITKGDVPLKERKWKSILKGRILSTAISKLDMRLVRRYDQDERDPDGAIHRNSI